MAAKADGEFDAVAPGLLALNVVGLLGILLRLALFDVHGPLASSVKRRSILSGRSCSPISCGAT